MPIAAARRSHLLLRVVVPLELLLCLFSCGRGDEPAELAPTAGLTQTVVPVQHESVASPRCGLQFTDVTDAVGLDFTHDAGLDGTFFMPQIMGAGVALFDYDGDGDLDIYLINGHSSNRLYRQESSGRFVDATNASGLGDPGYGMGVAVGDIDNDGDLDVYVTNFGPDALYVNQGNGTFRNETRAAGLTSDRWTTSAAFADLDGDGWLDLYVVSYLDYDRNKPCLGGLGQVIYCAPDMSPGTADYLYKNRGDGRFVDASIASGIARYKGRGLGVAIADLNGDARPDIYVANDGEPNWLFINNGGGNFVEEALVRGAAVNDNGSDEASMGVIIADLTGDVGLDVFLTHLTDETHTLYMNEGYLNHGGVHFRDVTTSSGLGIPSIPFTGFGTVASDFDGDGDLDIAVVNGAVGSDDTSAPTERATVERAYGQHNQLFENVGFGHYRDASDCVPDFANPVEVSRGLASGDVDGDGDIDLVISNMSGRARVLRNDAVSGRQLRVVVRDPATRRVAEGALVTVSAGEQAYVRLVTAGGSYLSSSEPVAHFALPNALRVDLRIRWPDGQEQSFADVPTDHMVTASRGRDELDMVPPRRPRSTPTLPAAAPLVTVADDPAVLEQRVLTGGLDGAEPQVRAAIEGARAAVVAHGDVATWGRLGVLYHAHLRLDDALFCYRRAAALEPRDPRLPYLAGVIMAERSPATAVTLFDQTLALNPKFIPAMVRRAQVQRQLGQVADAARQYHAALTLDPGCASAHLGLGQLEELENNLTSAAEHMRQAVQSAPRGAEPRRELARILARLGQESAAQREREVADGLSDDHDTMPDPLLAQVLAENISIGGVLRRAAGYRQLRDFPAAIRELDHAIGFRPDSATLYNNRALVHADRGAVSRALADLDRAIELDPKLVSAWVNRAEVLARAGEGRKAAEDLRHALTLEPSNQALARRLKQLER